MSLTLVHEFAVTIPAGTPIAAPVTTSTKFGGEIVDRISWRIPHGALGVVGFYIGMRGVSVIPTDAGSFLISDGNSADYDTADQPHTGDWSVTGYNTGAFSHTVYVTFITHRIDTRLTIPAWLSEDTVSELAGYEL